MSFPGGSDGKESTCNVGDLGSISGLGRSPGGGHGNPLQYSCLENPHGQRSLEGYSSAAAAAAKSLQSCLTLCDPIDGSPPDSSPWDLPVKNTGVGCHFLLHEIFPTQGSNSLLLHWQAASLPVNHLKSESRSVRSDSFQPHGLFSRQEYWGG